MIAKPRVVTICILVVMLALFLTGCSSAVSPDVDAIYTQAAETFVADLTQQAPEPTTPPTVMEAEPPTAPPLPVDTLPPPTPTPTSPPQAIFADDFSSKTGWASTVGDNYSYGYTPGGYFISVDSPYTTIWSMRDINLDNVRLQTNAKRIAGPVTGYYGVSCRHQDGSNYYILVIASDGFYGIGKMENAELEFIQQGIDQAGTILGGDAINRVQGDCIGSTLRLYANGQTLLEAQDSAYQRGATGLVAGTFAESGLQVLYENFVILQP